MKSEMDAQPSRNHPARGEGPAIVHSNHDRALVREIGDAHEARQRQGRMRGGYRVHIVALPDRRLAAMELPTVPTGDTALTHRLARLRRCIRLAKRCIGLVRVVGERLMSRYRFGYVLKLARSNVAGTVVLKELAVADCRCRCGRARVARAFDFRTVHDRRYRDCTCERLGHRLLRRNRGGHRLELEQTRFFDRLGSHDFHESAAAL